jgi:predicted amidohydrolase
MFERSEDPERAYNTVVALGSDGGLLARYRKIHLYDSFVTASPTAQGR